MTDQKYARAIKIARENGLEAPSRFVRFLIEWGDIRGKDWTQDECYAGEWAKRFKKGYDYLDASGDAMVALVHVDGVKQAIQIYADEIIAYNGTQRDKAIAEAKKKIARCFESEKIPVPQELNGYNITAKPTQKKKDCICQSAEKMIGKLPNFDKNFKNITR